jgi:DNA end-binding protein Ku
MAARQQHNQPEAEEGVGERKGMWSGTLTFGLVSIPVSLRSAVRSLRVALRMLDDDGTPLSRRYVCSKDQKPLDADDIVRGYAVDKDEYVIVTDDELEALAPEKSRDIDLRRFVKRAEIDPVLFDRPYYLAPAGGSSKAYRLLAHAMEHSDRAGVATFVMRDKEYLVAILAQDGVLRAQTLRFADEVRSPKDIALPKRSEAQRRALTRVQRAVQSLSSNKLNAAELIDERERRLLELIAAKNRDRQDVVEAKASTDADEDNVIDLMQQLKLSLGRTAAPTNRRAARPSSAAPARRNPRRKSGRSAA